MDKDEKIMQMRTRAFCVNLDDPLQQNQVKLQQALLQRKDLKKINIASRQVSPNLSLAFKQFSTWQQQKIKELSQTKKSIKNAELLRALQQNKNLLNDFYRETSVVKQHQPPLTSLGSLKKNEAKLTILTARSKSNLG